MSVNTAVILAAGLGTRMGTISEYYPKWALPIGGRPAIWHCIQEARAAGIEKIRVVIPFPRTFFLHEMLLRMDPRIEVEVSPFGFTNALQHGLHGVDSPVLLVFPDEVPQRPDYSGLKEAIATYTPGDVVIGVKDVDGQDGHFYGIVTNKSIIEKPTNLAPGLLYKAARGRYILPVLRPEFQDGTNISEVICNYLLETQKIVSTFEINTPLFDIGSWDKYVQAIREFEE